MLIKTSFHSTLGETTKQHEARWGVQSEKNPTNLKQIKQIKTKSNKELILLFLSGFVVFV